MRLIRVVIDTNQLLRMAAAGEQSPLLRAWRQRSFHLVISAQLVAELEAVITRPKTQRFLRLGRAKRLLNLIRERAIFVTPAADAPTCRDPKDDIVIATAVAAQASYIVTADRDLLDDEALQKSLTEHSLQVVYPAEFLNLLDK
jgi:putative PIN family toxin of toxin-antitoxin system